MKNYPLTSVLFLLSFTWVCFSSFAPKNAHNAGIECTKLEDVIQDDGFMQYRLGQRIEPSPGLKKEMIEADGTSRPVYRILNEQEEVIGSIYLERDKPLISAIEITAAAYQTEEGIQVGDSFEEIAKAYPDASFHAKGTEVFAFLESTLSFQGEQQFPLAVPYANGVDLHARVLSILIADGC